MLRIFGVVFAVLASGTQAQNSDDFVRANLLSVLYHELGHAIIDTAQLPIFGQEEDAADMASILLINDLFDEEGATNIAYNSAFGFLGEANANSDAPAWSDVHGADLQRFYNLVCVFAGADLAERGDIADDLGLPKDRQDTCEDEFDLAIDSWGPVFDDLAEHAPGTSMVYNGATDSLLQQLVANEVADLNLDFVMPETLLFSVQTCDEPNAFYDPKTVEIIMCEELVDWLRALPID